MQSKGQPSPAKHTISKKLLQFRSRMAAEGRRAWLQLITVTTTIIMIIRMSANNLSESAEWPGLALAEASVRHCHSGCTPFGATSSPQAASLHQSLRASRSVRRLSSATGATSVCRALLTGWVAQEALAAAAEVLLGQADAADLAPLEQAAEAWLGLQGRGAAAAQQRLA